MNKTNLDEAIKLSELNWSIIPIGNNKKPLVKWKEFQERLATKEEITSWFKRWPNANIAVVTGKISNVIVFDIDAKHGREIREFQIPPTIISKTGGGGNHIFFKYPDRHVPNSNGTLFGEGIDIKGDDGYAIVPYSSHKSGNFYEWVEMCSPFDIEPIDVPNWLYNKLFENNNSDSKTKLWEKETSDVLEGTRNQTAASVAGKIINTIREENIPIIGWNMFKDWNKNIPSPLPEKELRSTWESIGKYHTTNGEESKPLLEKINITSWKQFSKKDFSEVSWRIQNLIPMEGFVILSAISGEKKTWVSLEMAKCIAEGINFLGTELFKTEQGKILYIDQENPERDIVRRGKQLGFKENENFYIYRPNSLNLNDEKIVKELLSKIKENNINVVFIDTFRAVAGGLKEDKAEDVRMFFNRFKILKDSGVVIVWLDHRRKPANFEGKVPKKEQLLGSQDKTASVEILLQLSSESGSNEIRVFQAKNRLDREINAFKIAMVDKDNEDGTRTTDLIYDGEIDEDETKKNEAKEYILELLGSGGKTTKEIKNTVSTQRKIGEKNIRLALGELVDSEQIDYSKKGRSHFYFIKETSSLEESEIMSLDDL
ncbi:MAG: bifunctional DNA primase/polymerase [bacterium]